MGKGKTKTKNNFVLWEMKKKKRLESIAKRGQFGKRRAEERFVMKTKNNFVLWEMKKKKRLESIEKRLETKSDNLEEKS